MTFSAGVHYRVQVADLHAHLFDVTLTVSRPLAKQRLQLPAWIPGSYLIREFARHVQGLTARQGRRQLTVGHPDKHSWDVECVPDRPLTLQYQVYAFDNSVRAAWLDTARGFFNGTALLMRALGQDDQAHTLDIVCPEGVDNWQLATSLKPLKADSKGFGTYAAVDYDELVDSPVEMGAFWSGEFVARGVPHRFVVAGAAPSFDGDRLLADAKKICETAMDFWRSAAHDRYVFMLNAVDNSYGGLEHRNSTALICKRQDLPRHGETGTNEGYTTLLGLISHEYFHTWNVKRLRPAEFATFDYQQENYTDLLWFFEGFTSYYDDLLLRRAGLLNDGAYLKLLNKTINQVLQTPGRLVQSVAQASFDAWIKYYRQDENTANATVSYYTKGSLVALCLDLSLREQNKTSLDAVMRELWRRCDAGPMSEADLMAVLRQLGGRSYAKEIRSWVRGVDELPLKPLLAAHGVDVKNETAQLAQALGLRVQEDHGIRIQTVLREGAAEQAGLAAGDEWLAVEVAPDKGGQAPSGWRLHKLDDLRLYAPKGARITAIVARDKQLLRLPITVPLDETSWKLTIRDAPLVSTWLASATES